VAGQARRRDREELKEGADSPGRRAAPEMRCGL